MLKLGLSSCDFMQSWFISLANILPGFLQSKQSLPQKQSLPSPGDWLDDLVGVIRESVVVHFLKLCFLVVGNIYKNFNHRPWSNKVMLLGQFGTNRLQNITAFNVLLSMEFLRGNDTRYFKMCVLHITTQQRGLIFTNSSENTHYQNISVTKLT